MISTDRIVTVVESKSKTRAKRTFPGAQILSSGTPHLDGTHRTDVLSRATPCVGSHQGHGRHVSDRNSNIVASLDKDAILVNRRSTSRFLEVATS